MSTGIEIVNSLANRAIAEARSRDVGAAKRTVHLVDSLAKTYSPTPLHTAIYVAQAYAALGDTKLAIWWLNRYQVQRDLHFQIHLRCDPPFKPISSDAAFRSLLIAGSYGSGC